MEFLSKVNKGEHSINHNFMNKSLLFRSISVGIMSVMVLCVIAIPQAINADTPNLNGNLKTSTLVHNGHLTFCKIDKSAYHVVKTIKKAVVTGYSSTEDQTDSTPFITASGFDLRKVKDGEGIIATNILPLGTKVRIDGVVYTVEDRMNARYNGKARFDKWFAGEEVGKKKAIEFGFIITDVEVIES